MPQRGSKPQADQIRIGETKPGVRGVPRPSLFTGIGSNPAPNPSDDPWAQLRDPEMDRREPEMIDPRRNPTAAIRQWINEPGADAYFGDAAPVSPADAMPFARSDRDSQTTAWRISLARSTGGACPLM